jgi:hypothetical protein
LLGFETRLEVHSLRNARRWCLTRSPSLSTIGK